MLRFLMAIIALFVVLVAAMLVGTQLGWPMPQFWTEILTFLFVITMVIGYNLMKLQKKQPQIFIQFYLLSIVLKMVAGLAFLFFLIEDTPAETMGNGALFILSYILFTGVEVLFLVRKQP